MINASAKKRLQFLIHECLLIISQPKKKANSKYFLKTLQKITANDERKRKMKSDSSTNENRMLQASSRNTIPQTDSPFRFLAH